MKYILCGVIGAGGYLGQQLGHYIKKYNLPIKLIPYNRKLQEFSTDKYESQNFDVLLNLGTPNEVFSRYEGPIAQKAIEEWSVHLEIAIRLSRPLHIVHLSTFHIFGNPDGEIDDNYLISGGNAYGDLHLRCLEFVKKITSDYGIALSIVIPSNIYGTISPNLIPRTDLILNLAIQNLRINEPIKLRSNGLGLRDFLWIEDALRAFCAIVSQKLVKLEETIVIASGMTTSVRSALELLFSVLGVGKFESWSEFGSINENVVHFSLSCKNLKLIMDEWQPQSVLSAAARQKSIFN